MASILTILGMSIYQLDDLVPEVDPSAFVADSAQVIGDVNLGADSSVWFGTVIRGDSDRIRVGAGSNIQDASVLHADQGYPLTIGERVTVGLNLPSGHMGSNSRLGDWKAGQRLIQQLILD